MNPNDHIHHTLGSLVAKVDILIERTEKTQDDNQKIHERLTAVENAHGTVKMVAGGIASAVAFVVTAVVAYFGGSPIR